MSTPMPISGVKYKQSIDVTCSMCESFDWPNIPLLRSLLEKIESNEINNSDASSQYLAAWNDTEESIRNIINVCNIFKEHYEHQLYHNWKIENTIIAQ
jgi:hypothetical protein